MNRYRLEWEPKEADLPWQYDFDMVSDAMAIEFAKKHYDRAYIRLGTMALKVWRLGDDCVTVDKLVSRLEYQRLEYRLVDTVNVTSNTRASQGN